MKIIISITLFMLTTSIATAHHSAARFDTKATIEITGVIKEFAWKNPHTWIKMDVTDDNGNVVEWSFEGNGATYLLRTGWRRTSLNPGDKVTVVGNPLQSGEPGGRFFGAKLADGTTVGLDKDGKRLEQS